MSLNLVKKVKLFKDKDGKYIPIRDLTDNELLEAKKFTGNRIDGICNTLNKLEKTISHYERKNEIFSQLWEDLIDEYERRFQGTPKSNSYGSSHKPASKPNLQRNR